jgi:hypothetical protein
MAACAPLQTFDERGRTLKLNAIGRLENVHTSAWPTTLVENADAHS